jgi:LemA protein
MSPTDTKSFFRRNIWLIFVLVIVLWGVFVYNGLVSTQEGVEGQWGNVENAYKRRADLIPNLVNTVQSYAEFERGTLTEVIEARAKATQITVDPTNMSPQQLAAFDQAQGQLGGALSKLLAVFERYPDLKANQNYMDLQKQLEGTENRISEERRKFNETAKAYNIRIRRFPANFIAGIFGFDKRPYFDAPEGAEEAPSVDSLFKD